MINVDFVIHYPIYVYSFEPSKIHWLVKEEGNQTQRDGSLYMFEHVHTTIYQVIFFQIGFFSTGKLYTHIP